MKKEVYWCCNRPWEYTFTDEFLIDEDDKVNHGSTIEGIQKTRVTERESCRDTVRETALHESWHINYKTASNGLPSDEEDAVVAATTAQYSAFRDPRNLWFWRMMLEGIAEVIPIPEKGKSVPRKGTKRRKR